MQGGNFPVAGARVDLWYPGVSGYGSAPTSLAHVTTASDGTGSFSFPANSYTCPASDMPVYLTVTGGNPGLTSTGNWVASSGNSYLALMAAIGSCGNASSLTGLKVNEVTTVATVFATAQFSGASQAANGLTTVNNYTISNGGSGYLAASLVTLTFTGGGCTTEPTAQAILVNGSGSLPTGTFNTSTPGAGCTSAPDVAATSGSGSGVVATASFAGVGQSGSVGGLTIGSVGAATPAGGLAGNTAANGNNIGAPIGTVTGGALTVTNPLAYTDLKNAFALVNNLVNIYYGMAVPSFSNVTVPTAKLYTMADILADCVQSDGVTADGSQCANIAALTPTGVTPTGHTVPTDTVQIATYMALAPYTNLANVYAFATGQPVYGGTLAAAPFDWTLNLVYNNVGMNYSTGTGGAMAADAGGNIWAITSSGNGGLVGISPMGQSLSGGTPYDLTGLGSPQSVVVDPSNNVWVSNRTLLTNSLVELSSSTLTSTSFTEAPQGSTGCGSSFLAMDNNLNLLYNCSLVTTTPIAPLNGFLNTGTIAAPVYTSGSSSTLGNVATMNGASTYAIQARSDQNGNIWVPNYITTNCSVSAMVPNVNPAFGTPTSYTSNTYAPSTAGGSNGVSLEVDHNGTVWFPCSTGYNHIPVGAAVGSTGVHVSATNQFISAKQTAIDGAGNIWVLSTGTTAATGTYAGSFYSVSEFNNAGTLMTPVLGSTQAPTVPGPLGIPVFASGTPTYPVPTGTTKFMTVDGSGNVWVDNLTASTGTVVQLVGVAVPSFAPLGAAAQQNRIGTLP
ncbi:MAG: hypothetical protein P4L10_09255 [Acidobacteriaceae bacterium]|nr:hypothetical protein [Acidobacteriaceae bacterium]